MKPLNFEKLHSLDLSFVSQTWLYPDTEDWQVFLMNCIYSIAAKEIALVVSNFSVFRTDKKTLESTTLACLQKLTKL